MSVYFIKKIVMEIKKDYILEKIELLKPSSVLVVGDLILDEFVTGEVVRLSREAPIPIVNKKYTEYIPGGAANTANNIVSLSGKAYSLGTIGNDLSGENLQSVLEKLGVNTESLVLDENNPTTTKTRISAYSKQSVKQQVARVDTLPDPLLNEQVKDKLLQNLHYFANRVDTILISDYGNGVVFEQIIEEALKIGEKTGKNVVVDSQGNLGRFQKATLLTPNQPEAEEVVGYKIRNKETLEKAGNDLLKLSNAKAVLITRGSEGMSLFESNGETTHIPAFNKREVFDVTGAGDTVVSTFSLGISSGLSMKDAMLLANLAASIVIRRFGTAVTTINEMKNVLISNE
ncbi:MAG: bifunctional ADP-heptose synthase [Candidatus Sericytochromatia bacterium]